MPLEEGKGRAAFEANLKTELAAGHPKTQALAIAYAKQRGDEQPNFLDKLRATADALSRSDRAKPAHTITLELNDGDFVGPLALFFAQVKATAEIGHSFYIEADRDDAGAGRPRCGVDGDGADRILRVLLDGEEVKLKKDERPYADSGILARLDRLIARRADGRSEREIRDELRQVKEDIADFIIEGRRTDILNERRKKLEAELEEARKRGDMSFAPFSR